MSKIIIEYNQNKDISILRYGLKVICLNKYNRNNWPEMQSKLLNLLVRFPSLADLILIVFVQNKEKLQKLRITKAIYSIMDTCILLMHEQEMIWAVWYVKVFELNISHEYIKLILESENTLAIIIILDIIKSRKINNNTNIMKLIDVLFDRLVAEDTDTNGQSNNIMWTNYWLLAYEADKSKWLNRGNRTFDLAKKNQFFKELLSRKIEFYDASYKYEEQAADTGTFQFATKKELYGLLSRLRKSIIATNKDQTKETKYEFSNTDDIIYGKLISELSDFGYMS